MAYIYEIMAGHPQWVVYSVTLLAGTFTDGFLALVMRRGFGRGLGPFRMIRLARILFVLIFTTILGPIVLVAILVFAGYWFFANRRS
jgi:hypothetical protein